MVACTDPHFPKHNPNFRDITQNVEEKEILHKIVHVVSRIPRYISFYISENRLPLGHCTTDRSERNMVWSDRGGRLKLVKSSRLFYSLKFLYLIRQLYKKVCPICIKNLWWASFQSDTTAPLLGFFLRDSLFRIKRFIILYLWWPSRVRVYVAHREGGISGLGSSGWAYIGEFHPKWSKLNRYNCSSRYIDKKLKKKFYWKVLTRNIWTPRSYEALRNFFWLKTYPYIHIYVNCISCFYFKNHLHFPNANVKTHIFTNPKSCFFFIKLFLFLFSILSWDPNWTTVQNISIINKK